MAKDKGKKKDKPSAMADGFAKPSDSSGGDKWKLTDNDNLGELFIIVPTRRHESVKTVNGDKEAIECDIVHVHRKKPGEKSEMHEGVYVFSLVLLGSLKGHVGTGRVLGVLAKGEASPGKNAPWKLDNASDEDEAAARVAWNSIDPFKN